MSVRPSILKIIFGVTIAVRYSKTVEFIDPSEMIYVYVAVVKNTKNAACLKYLFNLMLATPSALPTLGLNAVCFAFSYQ